MLLVLLSHLSLHGIHLLPFLNFSGAGKSGVYLFFVLSAFLLTLQALQQGELGVLSMRYWSGYFIRRICRIYPLFFLVLILAFALTTLTGGYGPKIETFEEILMHLGLQAGESIYWAIPVEFKYYLLLPLVVISLLWSARVHVSLTYIIVVAAILGIHIYWPADRVEANSIGLAPYLQMFLLGSLAAFVSASDLTTKFRLHSNLLGALGWLCFAVALVTIPAAWRFLVDASAGNQALHRLFLFYGLLWSAAVLAAAHGSAGFPRFFELAPWRFLGRISFSVYLLHLPLVQFVARHTGWPASVQFLFLVALIVLVSYLSYRIVERPAIAWGHKVTSNKLPGP